MCDNYAVYIVCLCLSHAIVIYSTCSILLLQYHFSACVYIYYTCDMLIITVGRSHCQHSVAIIVLLALTFVCLP